MSKASRVKQKAIRDKKKKARRTANYVRFGPKAGSPGKKKKTKVVGGDTPPKPMRQPRTSAKGRRRRRRNGLRWAVKK